MKKLNLYGLLFLLVFFAIKGYSQPIFIENIPVNSTNFISANGKLYFTSGTDLYRSDGTPQGTAFVKSIGEPILEFTNLTVGNFFYFTTQEAGGKTALWKSNGYANNTFKIRSADVIKPLLTYNVALYLGIDDGVHGYELWRATSANSFNLVKDVYPGLGSGLGDEIVVFNNALYFKGYHPVTGSDIWKTNGTSVTNIAVNLPFTGSYGSLTEVGSTLYFSRNYIVNNIQYAELWKTNGTTPGTALVKQFTNDEFAYIGIEQLIKFNNTLYFKFYFDGGARFDNLYKSNGTEAGTTFVETLNIDGSMSDLIEVNNHLVFDGSSQGWPGSLKVTQGDGSGFYFLHFFNVYDPRKYIGVGDLLFFVDHTEETFGGLPQDSDNYFQLFQSGFEASNTSTLKSIFGTSYAGCDNLTAVNSKLFFTTHNDYPGPGGCPACPKKLFVYNPSSSGFRTASSEESVMEFTAFPNPSDAMFNFSLVSNTDGNATAEIFRLDGALVAKVFEGSTAEGEKVEFNWNADGLPGGVYFCKFTSGSKSIVKRLILSN
jgi:ELWxxDGT repeat protein